jgi:hypothetical protein
MNLVHIPEYFITRATILLVEVVMRRVDERL